MQEYPVLDCVLLRAGWGRGRQRGLHNEIFREYFSEDFLASLCSLLPGAPVQVVECTPQQAIAQDHAPDLITWLVTELLRYGHPPGFVNTLFSLGLVGNAFGFLQNARIEKHQKTIINNVVLEGMILRCELVVLPAGLPILKLMGDAWTAGLPTATSLSTNYRGNVVFGSVDGKHACKWIKASRLISTEFVMHPGAGGVILGLKRFDAPRSPQRKIAEQMELMYG